MLDGQSNATIVIFVAGLALLTWAITRMQLQKQRRRDRDAAKPPPGTRPLTNDREAHDMNREMRRLLAELQDAARRISSQIDNRYAKLDALLQEADRKIQHIEGLTRSSEAPPPHLSAGSHDRAFAASMHEAVDPKQAQIYALADRGQSPRDIAQQLGTQPGEIELILALRSRQPSV